MKILVVFLLCGSVFGLPVDDRIVSPEELLQRVLAAHPLENDIELNKRKNEIPLPNEVIPLPTLENRIGSTPYISAKENVASKGIFSQVIQQDVHTKTEAPEGADISSVAPEASEETKRPVLVSSKAGSTTVDPKVNITEYKPSSKDQYSIAFKEPHLNNTDSGITTDTSVEKNETIPDEAKTQGDVSTQKELTEKNQRTKSSEHSLPIKTNAKKTDGNSLTDGRPNKDVSAPNDSDELYQDITEPTEILDTTETIPESLNMENIPFLMPKDTLLNEPDLLAGIPMEKSPSDASLQDNTFSKDLNGVEDVVNSGSYQYTTEPTEIFYTTETILEGLDQENIPFIMPEHTLLNEPELLAEVPMEETPTDGSIQDNKFNKNPERIKLTPVELSSDISDLDIKNHPLVREMSSDPGMWTDFEPRFEEEGALPYIGEDEIKILPEEFRAGESPGLFSVMNPTTYPEKGSPNYSQNKDIFPFIEEEELLKNPSSQGKLDTDTLEDSTLKNYQLFRSELDPSLLVDGTSENIPGLKNLTESKLNDNSNHEDNMGRDEMNETQIMKENSNGVSFSLPVMDEEIEHDAHIINQAVELELHTPIITFSENQNPIKNESFLDIDSTIEDLKEIPASRVDSFSEAVLGDSDFVEDPVNQETLDYDPIANMDAISNGNPDASSFFQEPVIHEAFDNHPIIELDPFLDETYPESALTHEMMPEELAIDSATIVDEFPHQKPDELEFNQYHTIADQLRDEANAFMDEGTVLINPESTHDNTDIEENSDLSHYESDFTHEMIPERLDLRSETIADQFLDQSPVELDRNQPPAIPYQLSDEVSTFVEERTASNIPGSIAEKPYIRENPNLSHFESELVHEIMPEQLDQRSEAIADKLDFNPHHAIAEQHGDEESTFIIDDGTLLFNPESLSENPFIEQNYELSQEPVAFIENFNDEAHVQDLSIVKNQDLPYEDPENLNFDMKDTVPIQEFPHLPNHNSYEESSGDPSEQQLWRLNENYPGPYMPVENDGQAHLFVEEDIDNLNIPDPVTEETTEETFPSNMRILEISGEESLSSRAIDSSDGQIKANNQGKVPSKITDEGKITYVAKKPRLEAPVLESNHAYYPYSLFSQDYQPFYIPYPTEHKFLDESPKKTDYKSLIIIVNPPASNPHSDSTIPSDAKSRSEFEISPDLESRSELDIPSNDINQVDIPLKDDHNSTLKNIEVKETTKNPAENASDLPLLTTPLPEFPQKSTQPDSQLKTSTKSDLTPETSSQTDLPQNESTQPDLTLRKTTQPNLPPITTFQPDLPPRTPIQPDVAVNSNNLDLPPRTPTQSDLVIKPTPSDMPPRTKFQPELPQSTSFQPELPPIPSFKPNLPPRPSFQPGLPPRTSFQPDLPPITSFQPDLPPRTSFQPDLEIPYPSKDQDFHSRPKDVIRKPFTWYPILREEQQSDFSESRPGFSKEYDYIFVHPNENTFNDFFQLSRDNYRYEYGSPHYQISDDISSNDYEILPYYERDQSYNKDREDLYNGFYY